MKKSPYSEKQLHELRYQVQETERGGMWIKSIALPAVVPPPEELKKVESAIGAARAEYQRDHQLKAQL